jgi:hypothetical protein
VAKPTRRYVGTVKAGNKLPMASQVLLYKTDEVARNGVLGKLRPEVNPGAPLHNWIVNIPFGFRTAFPRSSYSKTERDAGRSVEFASGD